MMRIESSLSVLKVVVAWYKVLRLLKRSAIYATIRAMAKKLLDGDKSKIWLWYNKTTYF